MSKKSRNLARVEREQGFEKYQEVLFQVLLIGVVFFVFWNVLSANYVSWDDNVLIEQNNLLKLPFLEFIKADFSHYYDGDYFPLTLLSFWTELNGFGWMAPDQHLANVVLHCINILLLFQVLKKLRIPDIQRLVICALFAIHPTQVESVAWISERRGLLCGFFFLLSFLFYQKTAEEDASTSVQSSERTRLRNQILSSLFYLASLLSKFTGVLLPVLMVGMDRIYFKRKIRDSIVRHLPLLLIGFFASVFRIMAYLPYVSESRIEFNSRLIDGGRLLQLPEMISTALSLYLRNFIAPYALSVVYPIFQPSLATQLSVALVAAILFLLFLRWRKSSNPHYLFFSLFTFLFLLPVLQLIPRINFINDRYLYLPIIGFSGLLVTLIDDFFRGIRLRWLPVGVWVLILVGAASQRTSIWLTNESLWADTVVKYPESAVAHNNLGLAYTDVGKDRLAISEFEKAIAYGEKGRLGEVAGYTNIGHIYMYSKDPEVRSLEKAEFFFKRAVEGNKRLEDGYTPRLNLALVEMLLNKRDEAISTLRSLQSDLQNSSQDQRYGYLLERSRTLMEKILAESARSSVQK